MRHRLLAPFKGDRAIWVIFLALAIISLISVFSSIGYTAISTHSTPERAFIRHLIFVIMTFVMVILLSNIDYRHYSKASWFGYILSISLLALALIIGHAENESGSGMSRWINIPYLGSFQPSELAKIVIVIYLARLLAQERDHLGEWETFRKILVPILIIVGLVVFENLSMAVIIFFVCFAMLRIAPIPASMWRKTVVAIILVGVLAIFVGNKMEISFLSRSGTWAGRIDRWLHFDQDELTQEGMARMAVASGRFIGVGVGSTIQARLMTQANNDLIYAIIIEEAGMLGGIAVFMLYLWLYIRCIKIAWRCKSIFARMSVVGLGTLIFLQAAIHMSVSVGALPVTGQTLPFVSSGGSSYLCMGLAIGVIQSIAYDVDKREQKERKEAKRAEETTETVRYGSDSARSAEAKRSEEITETETDKPEIQ